MQRQSGSVHLLLIVFVLVSSLAIIFLFSIDRNLGPASLGERSLGSFIAGRLNELTGSSPKPSSTAAPIAGESPSPQSSTQPTSSSTQSPTSGGGSGKSINFEHGFSFADINSSQGKSIAQKVYSETGADLYRFSIDWAQIESTRGQYNWTNVDKRIDWLFDNNIKLMLTIRTNAPEWAADVLSAKGATIKPENIVDFENFVRELMQRYSDKIDIIQFGNEWQGNTFFPGTGEQFVDLNNRIYALKQQHLPDAEFVLGGISTSAIRIIGIHTGTLNIWRRNNSSEPGDIQIVLNQQRFIDVFEKSKYVLEHANYDLIDLHLYFDIDEWDEHISTVRVYDANTPIIVSEWGATHPVWSPNPTDSVMAQNMQKALDKLNSLGIKKAYHFSIVVGQSGNDLFRYCGVTGENNDYPLLYGKFKDYFN